MGAAVKNVKAAGKLVGAHGNYNDNSSKCSNWPKEKMEKEATR
jgi:hypothetical protein